MLDLELGDDTLPTVWDARSRRLASALAARYLAREDAAHLLMHTARDAACAAVDAEEISALEISMINLCEFL